MDWTSSSGRHITLKEGDITAIPADAIVNAANSALVGGGGVDGAIHRAAGREMSLELEQIRQDKGGCKTGSAVVTGAGKMPAKFIFHAVGPVFRDGRFGEPAQLASCYRTCLQLAEERELKSISFPAISTGIYGFPKEEAASIAVGEVKKHLEKPEGSVREVIFVLYDHDSYQYYARYCKAR